MTEAQYTPGRFVWYEIFTNDMEATKSFYTGLFDWTIKVERMGDTDYPMILAGEMPVAGMMPLEVIEMEGVPPHWLSYVSVPDVKEAAAAVKSGGGTVLVEPRDMPPVGAFTVLQDPQGAVIAGWRSARSDPPEVDKWPVGAVCWTELVTPDPKAALAFYQKVFGWQNVPFEGGDDMWVFTRGERQAASVGKAPEGAPAHWLNFVYVEDLAVSRKRAVELGGKVMMEEVPVPGIGKFSIIQDNIGAVIALFEGTES